MMKASCHCGAVSWTLAQKPEKLTQCNCSICRKLGTLWAHAPIGEVTLSGGPTVKYVREDCDGGLAFHSCATCGCTTHWENLSPSGAHMAVNTRLADPHDLDGIPVRLFDGADTWKYLD